MSARPAIRSILSIAIAAGCGTGADAPSTVAPVDEQLPPGVAARVGDETISSKLIGRVARAQGVTPKDARSRLVQDALFAALARQELAPGVVSAAERSGQARAVLELLAREARAAGEPTDAEVARIVAARWLELDRPASARTSHAVVRLGTGVDPNAARALAARIAKATRGAGDAEQFREAASAVPAGDLKVRVEQLPPVTADGRIVPPPDAPPERVPGRLDPRFAAAANAIETVGEQSPVIESEFGFHVIFLEERLPEKRVAPERQRELVRDEVFAARARALKEEVLEAARGRTPIQTERAASALTAEVRVR